MKELKVKAIGGAVTPRQKTVMIDKQCQENRPLDTCPLYSLKNVN